MADNGIKASFSRAAKTVYDDLDALAEAFGAPILAPMWWPADVQAVAYSLVEAAHAHRFQIGSIRRGGAPILVAGRLEIPGAGSPRDWLDGEWSEPETLRNKRGAIGRVGNPPQFHAVVYELALEVQLIGYAAEDELLRAIESLRSVGSR